MESRPGPDAKSLVDPISMSKDPHITLEDHYEDRLLKRKASSPSHSVQDGFMPKKPRRRSRSPSRSRSPYWRRDRGRDHDRQRDRDRHRGMDRYHQYASRGRVEPPREPERQRERRQEPESRPSLSAEEKQRGKRFFRGLLSSLNREPRAAQKKHRDEIERRQKEKAEQRKAAEEERKAVEEERKKNLARLEPIRKAEQIGFEERAMRTRHSNIMAQAHSLKTRSGPPIYFRPWEMTRKQEDAVGRQVLDAEEMVNRERRAFERKKQKKLAELRCPSPQPTIKNEGMTGEPRTEAPANTSLAVATNPAPPPPQHGSSNDCDGDVVMTEEDTLVY
ncbi:hypothetical protein GGTG_10026 [Gaeumannomyces tritici R3-111a-1]|uniref:Pinin/SDK/MemA protein domain-containing protein n=1 Tax=Gaeumannomyces tritici (strain R3-111a-1) TaxID=644352 RepID=J3P942_GAET3|nr:hypothetical protein GGTG_10026 [Gaeumannomyces tritici R3-111a-1]EJT73177.1 hypothetical protein GGTG_10026 [Gaeumannomyces tritici R3-111a-1]